MSVETVPLPLPLSIDASRFEWFGREVKDVDPNDIEPESEQFKEIERLLYKHSILLFKNTILTPEKQYALTKAFDLAAENFGHGNNKIENDKQNILNRTLRGLPRVPQVQLIGNGTVSDYEGFPEMHLEHPSHHTWHKTHLSPEDEAAGYTRFVRWHMDAALYDLQPPRITALYGRIVPKGPKQTVRYDDGTGDELEVPLAATAFTSGRVMFDILPRELKSVAVRGRVKYAPHPYVWVSTAKAMSTALRMETEGKEVPLDQLPPWEDSKIQIMPMVWKNPVTGHLQLQVHPYCVMEIYINPVPDSIHSTNALYPEGAHITDLQEVRDLLYKMQRPAISPQYVYPHEWQENDLIVFHNRGVLHSVTGTLSPDQLRVYHQCNLAASDSPSGPAEEDLQKWV